MSNAMNAIGKVFSFLLLLTVPALAQSWVRSGPVPAATGPSFGVSAGYTSLIMAIPGAGHVNLNGLDLSARMDLGSHWGAMVDSNYLRAANVFGTPRDAYVLSSYAGPVFYPVDHRKTRVSMHLLAGVARVGGAVPKGDGSYLHGFVVRPSYAVGGGVERHVSGPFALRVSGDYLRTAFFDSANAIRPQNNLRLTVGLVLHSRDRL